MRGRRARAAAAAAAAACALAASACGGPAADLFGVIRSGRIPGADVRIVPSSDGVVSCNGRSRELPSRLLLDAENLDLSGPAKRRLRLPSGRHPVYTYVVTTPDGTFSYSDDSPHQGRTLQLLSAWVYTVARTVCR